jgi:hypothetical protein
MTSHLLRHLNKKYISKCYMESQASAVKLYDICAPNSTSYYLTQKSRKMSKQIKHVERYYHTLN